MAKAVLSLLGPPRLEVGQRTIPLRSKKTPVMLAYLALEGPTPRARLAGLLWESPGARTNLRSELYRLNRVAPGIVLRAGKELALDAVEVDVHSFEALLDAGRYKEALERYKGSFLADLNPRVSPELEEWIHYHRARLQTRHSEALLRLAQRTEDPQTALTYLGTLRAADPLNEEALREAMRRLVALGEHRRALALYREHAAFLERELGLPPEPETRALAEAATRGSTRSKKRADRPFAGRERELLALTEAHLAGRTVFLSGEPGIGKTRLIREFVRHLDKKSLFLRARPGDRGVPYGTLARGIRELLALGAEPEGWVRRELARILPELGEPPEGENRVRFIQAFVELLAPFTGEDWVWGVDDLQYLDAASAELLLGIAAQMPPRPLLIAFRGGELGPKEARWVHEQLGQGRAVELKLGPLDAAATARMLGVPPELAERLAAYAGGNPFFLQQLAQARTQKLPPSQVQALIQERLLSLTPLPRRLAELAAVAGEGYDLEVATAILQSAPLDLAEASDALERLGLFRRGRPAHDLVAEAIYQGLAEETRRMWHRVLASALVGRVPPASLARHHLAAGDRVQAAERFLEAARAAELGFAYQESLDLYQEAFALLPFPARERAIADTLVRRYRLGVALADWERIRFMLDQADAAARELGDHGLHLDTAVGRADLAFRRGHFEEAKKKSAALLRRPDLRPDQRAMLIYVEAQAHLFAATRPPAWVAERCQAALGLADPSWYMWGWVQSMLALCRALEGKHDAARDANEKAKTWFAARSDLPGLAFVHRAAAISAWRQGRLDLARDRFEEALALARKAAFRTIHRMVLESAISFFEDAGPVEQLAKLKAELQTHFKNA